MKRILSVLSLVSLSLPAADKVIVHGHRGARTVLPENTIAAFEYAIRAGVDYIELDLAVTKDNILVVSHDPHLNPTICKAPDSKLAIRSLTLKQVREYDCGSLKNPLFPEQKPVPGAKIPTFDEVLALAGGGHFRFNIETKSSPKFPELTPSPDEFARLVLDAVKRHGLEKRVLLQSFDFRTLHAMKKIAPWMPMSALYSGAPKSFTDIARESDASIVSVHYKLVTPEEVKAAHSAGLRVIAWTPNLAEEWTRLIEAGVDEIITDDPGRLISFLKSRAR